MVAICRDGPSDIGYGPQCENQLSPRRDSVRENAASMTDFSKSPYTFFLLGKTKAAVLCTASSL